MINDAIMECIKSDSRFIDKKKFADQPIAKQGVKEISRRIKTPVRDKVKSMDYILDAVGLQDGMTISFHHSLRNGDEVMEEVIRCIANKGIKNLTLAASSLSSIQDKLLPYLECGVITAIDTSGCRGKLGEYIQQGKLDKLAIFRSHGGRARAIESGELHIDVAFIAAPICDRYGNVNGVEGRAACGSLGYAMCDARFADYVVAVTDTLVEQPLRYVSIPQTQVDYITVVSSIGDSSGIMTGSIRVSQKPSELVIANHAANLIAATSYFKNHMVFQFGSGGIAIPTANFLRKHMIDMNIVASAGVGGVSAFHTQMLEEGLIETFFDPQDFDLKAIQSLRNNKNHQEISVGEYANPFFASPYVNLLDIAVLSATEVDINFNVNVLTDSYGKLIGAPGGHPDAAAGAKFTVITVPLLRGRLPMLLDHVTTIVTPGSSVDAIVTDYGIAINPSRDDINEQIRGKGLPIVSIEELYEKAHKLSGHMNEIKVKDEVCGIVEYRDGTIIDVINQRK